MMRKERFMSECSPNICQSRSTLRPCFPDKSLEPRLRPVGRRSRVGLPDRDARDSRPFGHRVHLPRGLIVKIFREIFGGRIDDVEWRHIIQEFMVHAADDFAYNTFQMREIV